MGLPLGFLTGAEFGKMAASSTNIRVRLIDGRELIRLIIENNIGVSVNRTYEIKRVDMDFFEGI